MTNPAKYTEEQIKTAFSDDNDSLTCGELVANLQNPRWMPAVGEVFAYKHDGQEMRHTYYFGKENLALYPNARPLSITEIPALFIAVKALEKVSNPSLSIESVCNLNEKRIIREALYQIRAMGIEI